MRKKPDAKINSGEINLDWKMCKPNEKKEDVLKLFSLYLKYKSSDENRSK